MMSEDGYLKARQDEQVFSQGFTGLSLCARRPAPRLKKVI